MLGQNHAIFDERKEENLRTVVISSPKTWAARHGPNKLRDWRMKELNWTKAAAKHSDMLFDPDWSCPFLIPGKFRIVWVDEAHEIKRIDGHAAHAVEWLQPHFTGLSTATPFRNRLTDGEGYHRFIQLRNPLSEDERKFYDVDSKNFNPYTLSDDRASDMRLDLTMAKRWIYNLVERDDAKSALDAGYHMQRLNERWMIRRTFSSEVDGKAIGKSIPALIRRSMYFPFSEKSAKEHDRETFKAFKCLITVTPEGELVWNAGSFRTCILEALWTKFYHISEMVYANSIEKWKKSGDILSKWLEMVADGEEKAGRQFARPSPDTPLEQVKLVCQDAPRIGGVIYLLKDTIQKQKKVALWVLLPAEQLLLFEVIRRLKIDVRMYTSELTQDERDDIIQVFNNDPDRCHVLIMSYSLNSCGLDLQGCCHTTISVDTPISKAIDDQADCRFRRLGQRAAYVVSYKLSTPRTICDRTISKNMAKAVPTLMAELNSSVFTYDRNPGADDKTLVPSLGDWAVVNGKLFSMKDEFIQESLASGLHIEKLDAVHVLRQILTQERGEWVSINSTNRSEDQIAIEDGSTDDSEDEDIV